MGFSNFPRFYFNFMHVLPQNVVFCNLFQLKCLIDQTGHGTVHTAFFNNRWKRKTVQKITFSNFSWFFANFRTFCPQNMAICNPKWITFLICLTKQLTVHDAFTTHHLGRKNIKGMGFSNFPRFLHKNCIFSLKITNFRTSDVQRKWASDQHWYEEWFTTKIISVAISSRYGRILM